MKVLLEHFAGVLARGGRDRLASEHAGDLLDPGVAGEGLDEGDRAPALDPLPHPATVIGAQATKGSLEPGKDADLVVLDDRLQVQLTMVGGRIVYGSGRVAS